MNFNTLQYFIDIVDSGSFTKAAERNYVAQTALSHAVHKLEREFNTQLLIRIPGRVVPTKTGELFYQECKAILEIHRNTLKELEDLIPKKKIIRVGFIDIYECRDFKKLQERLEMKFPQYTFEWVDRYSVPEKEQDLVIGYDFELKMEQYSGNVTFKIDKAGISCLVSAGHAIAGKKSVSRKDILGQTLIFLIRDRNMDIKRYEKTFRQKYLRDIPCRIRYVYSSMERRTLVECNAGIAIFEKDMFRYAPGLCQAIDITDFYDIYYNISYRDREMKKIAKEIRNFFIE